MTLVHALGRFVRTGERARAGERCELCGLELGAAHPHLVALATSARPRSLVCACRACALLFTDGGRADSRYRTVPDRVLVDPSFALTEAEWLALEIPVGVAFFFFDSALARWTACYPSPGGPMESALPLAEWEGIAAAGRLIGAVEPDVEALLVDRRRGHSECFLAPIDTCYQLVAIVRTTWKGFDGGDEARRAIGAFFDGLRARGRTLRPSDQARHRASIKAAGGPP